MEVASGVGDGMFWVGLAAYMIEAGVGPEGFALAALARFGPRAVISAPAGVLADRVDRRRLLVGLDLGRAVAMLMLALVAAAGARYELLLLIVLGAYTLAAPYRPALTSALPLVAGERHLAAANAMVGATRQIMTFVGPVVGTTVLTVWSPAGAFALNAASFGVAAALVRRVDALAGSSTDDHPDLAEHRARWSRAVESGWREVWTTVGLGVVTLLVFVMYAARGAELVLLVFLAEDELGMGPSGVGILTGAIGLGAMVALPLASRVADSSRSTFVMTAAVVVSSAPLGLLASVRSPAIACVALALIGAGVVVFETLSVVLLQRLARPDFLGRVFGLVGAASNAGKLIGALAAPLLVATVDVDTALVVTGVGITAVAVASVPSLRVLAQAVEARRTSIRPTVDRLATLGLFDGASRAALERVASAIVLEAVPPGAVVVRQGDPADDLFVIRAGDFVVSDEGHTIDELTVDAWFGEIGLLQQRPRTATVTARTAGQLWRIPGAVFLGELQSGASAPAAVLEAMAERLSNTERAGRGRASA